MAKGLHEKHWRDFDQEWWNEYEDSLDYDDKLVESLAEYARGNDYGRVYLPYLAKNIAHHKTDLELTIRTRVNRFARKLEDLGYLCMWTSDTNEESQYRVWDESLMRNRPNDCYLHDTLWPNYTVTVADRAVGMIRVKNKKGDEGAGTATHIGSGRFLTCHHCFEEVQEAWLLLDTSKHDEFREYPIDLSSVIHVPEYDTALFEVNGAVHECIPVSSEHYAAPTDPVLVVHFPTLALRKPTRLFSMGEINARTHGYGNSNPYLAISSKTAPGSSGGAVVNRQGELVGIVTEQTRTDTKNEGFPPETFYFALEASLALDQAFEARRRLEQRT